MINFAAEIVPNNILIHYIMEKKIDLSLDVKDFNIILCSLLDSADVLKAYPVAAAQREKLFNELRAIKLMSL